MQRHCEHIYGVVGNLLETSVYVGASLGGDLSRWDRCFSFYLFMYRAWLTTKSTLFALLGEAEAVLP